MDTKHTQLHLTFNRITAVLRRIHAQRAIAYRENNLPRAIVLQQRFMRVCRISQRVGEVTP